MIAVLNNPQAQLPLPLTLSADLRKLLTPRWTPLRPHATQQALWNSQARFRVVPAGRRSGKTELAKRYLAIQALGETVWDDAWFVLSAPTHAQAKRIYWKDIKKLIPKAFIKGRPRESDMSIELINGAEITVIGLDTPERIEGRSLNGIIVDEYANVKQKVWTDNIRPALSDRIGWAWLIGVPEGRNHYFESYTSAQKEMLECELYNRINPPHLRRTPEWAAYTWFSEDILPESEIESAKKDLDPLSYEQEYRGSFLSFTGLAYYTFKRDLHLANLKQLYNPHQPLIFAFDFNTNPGVAVIIQEYPRELILSNHLYNPPHLLASVTQLRDTVTCVIDEVYVDDNSTTPDICDKLLREYQIHRSEVQIYADATGGAKTSASVRGSNLDLIRSSLTPAYGNRLTFYVPRANPKERVRVNSVTTRLLNAGKQIGMLLDATYTPYLQRDFEGVTLVEDGSGELEKKKSPKLTHISDAVGYYVHKRHPFGGHKSIREEA